MERRRRLADLLAMPAGELLSNRLDHLPLPRNHFEGLCDVLTHLYDLGRATAAAGCRCLDHNAFAWQMLGKRLAHRLAPLEGLARDHQHAWTWNDGYDRISCDECQPEFEIHGTLPNSEN